LSLINYFSTTQKGRGQNELLSPENACIQKSRINKRHASNIEEQVPLNFRRGTRRSCRRVVSCDMLSPPRTYQLTTRRETVVAEMYPRYSRLATDSRNVMHRRAVYLAFAAYGCYDFHADGSHL